MVEQKKYNLIHTPEEFIEWKVQTVHKTKGEAIWVPYIKKDYVYAYFNEVYPLNSMTTTSSGNMYRTLIDVYNTEHKVWISKSGYSKETDFEKEKGGSTASLKRAAARYGLGH